MCDEADLVALDSIYHNLAARIRDDHQLGGDALISRSELDRYRARYVEELLKTEKSELNALDRDVAASIATQESSAPDISDPFEQKRTFGETAADRLAAFGGSWTFIGLFGLTLLGWIGLNAAPFATGQFDPYPFILLNLVLSCLAALQAPIIMMSQRRLEEKDRLRSQSDYRINLKAELEIRHLHEKLDHLISKQWQRLAEIQQVQIEIMQEASRGRSH